MIRALQSEDKDRALSIQDVAIAFGILTDIRYSQIRTYLEETVTCRLCSKQFLRLPLHLKRIHQVSCEEYRIDYPEADIYAEAERAKFFGKSLITGKSSQRLFPHWEPIWTTEYLLDRALPELRSLHSCCSGAHPERVAHPACGSQNGEERRFRPVRCRATFLSWVAQLV